MNGEYGYYFHSREHSDSPGHPRLDVFLRSVPTGKHFDPEKLSLTIASEHRGTESLKIRHPWSWLKQYRACAGRVILQDRKGKKVEAFTFGGDLRIESEETLTTCYLTSPAPILELMGTSSIPELMAEEMEIVFAERRARWEPDHTKFYDRLAEVDPLTLYFAFLEALKGKFEPFTVLGDELVQQFAHFIQHEIKALQDLHEWPIYLPTIDELL